MAQFFTHIVIVLDKPQPSRHNFVSLGFYSTEKGFWKVLGIKAFRRDYLQCKMWLFGVT
jgi:hypothetical protein